MSGFSQPNFLMVEALVYTGTGSCGSHVALRDQFLRLQQLPFDGVVDVCPTIARFFRQQRKQEKASYHVHSCQGGSEARQVTRD
jgi:hypothetical protein